MTYLDNSATTRVSSSAADAALRAMRDIWGNPSSLHTMGFAAEQLMTDARRQVATLMGATPDTVYFTGGGSEANNLALFGAARARSKSGHHIVTTAVEHPSVAEPITALEREGFTVTRLVPDDAGTITAAAILAACREDTVLVSVMLVNNETGARFPVEKLTEAIHKRCPHALVHCDAVQAAGKIPLKAVAWGIDLMTVSAHKLHAPKGIGALYIAKNVRIPARTLGGGQEKGMRSGTESVPLIAAFGAAAAEVPSFAGQNAHFEQLRSRLSEGLQDWDIVRMHLPQDGVPYIVNFSLVGLKSETVVHFLAEKDIYVSGGSACAKGHRSPVLTALGLPNEEIDSALRVSFGYDTTVEDIDRLLAALHEADTVLAHTR